MTCRRSVPRRGHSRAIDAEELGCGPPRPLETRCGRRWGGEAAMEVGGFEHACRGDVQPCEIARAGGGAVDEADDLPWERGQRVAIEVEDLELREAADGGGQAG